MSVLVCGPCVSVCGRHTHTHTLTHTHACAHTIMHTNMHARAQTQTHTDAHRRTQTHMHTHTHTYTRTRTRTQTHTHIHSCYHGFIYLSTEFGSDEVDDDYNNDRRTILLTLFVYVCLLKQDDYEVWFFFQFSDDNENVCMYMCQQRWCDDTDIDNSMAIVVTMS